ncbi:hypothetical protein BKA93DRAFT_397198 [Sparassis latifolia]
MQSPAEDVAELCNCSGFCQFVCGEFCQFVGGRYCQARDSAVPVHVTPGAASSTQGCLCTIQNTLSVNNFPGRLVRHGGVQTNTSDTDAIHTCSSNGTIAKVRHACFSPADINANANVNALPWLLTVAFSRLAAGIYRFPGPIFLWMADWGSGYAHNFVHGGGFEHRA